MIAEQSYFIFLIDSWWTHYPNLGKYVRPKTKNFVFFFVNHGCFCLLIFICETESMLKEKWNRKSQHLKINWLWHEKQSDGSKVSWQKSRAVPIRLTMQHHKYDTSTDKQYWQTGNELGQNYFFSLLVINLLLIPETNYLSEFLFVCVSIVSIVWL